MKYLLLTLLCFAMQYVSCTKADKHRDCTVATITNSAPGCGGWGIVVKGTKYPSGNIPQEFQQDGMVVCANYELYEDMRLCVCCGGTWANITSMRKF
jgi:hypothetical protein